MNTIINLRGASGAGKTTLVRKLIRHCAVAESLVVNGNVPALQLNRRRPLFVLGRYTQKYGGADTIKTFAAITSAVTELALHGDVIFESLLWSTTSKSSIELARALPHHRIIFALLDTPLEVCTHRAVARRSRFGKTEPLDAKKLLAKYNSILRAQQRLKDAGLDTRTLPHDDALSTILNWLGISAPQVTVDAPLCDKGNRIGGLACAES